MPVLSLYDKAFDTPQISVDDIGCRLFDFLHYLLFGFEFPLEIIREFGGCFNPNHTSMNLLYFPQKKRENGYDYSTHVPILTFDRHYQEVFDVF